MDMYILKIRVGREYYPVTWPEGHVVWEEGGPLKPTLFDIQGRLMAEQELREARLEGKDYYFEHVEEPGQDYTPENLGTVHPLYP